MADRPRELAAPYKSFMPAAQKFDIEYLRRAALALFWINYAPLRRLP